MCERIKVFGTSYLAFRNCLTNVSYYCYYCIIITMILILWTVFVDSLFWVFFIRMQREFSSDPDFPTPHKTKIKTGCSMLLESSLLPRLASLLLFDLVFYLIVKQQTVQGSSPPSAWRESSDPCILMILHLDSPPRALVLLHQRHSPPALTKSLSLDSPTPTPAWASASSSHYTPVPPGV